MNPVSRNTLLALAAFIAALPIVRATTLTWDTTIAADSTITAGSGTWMNGSGNWNNGTTSSGITWSNATPDAAIFAGADGTYAITIGGGITSGSLSFNNSGYTLSASSAQTVTVSGIQIASGKTATIGNNVSVNSAGSLIIKNGGTLNIDTGGKITGAGAAADLAVNGGSTLNVQGGSLSTAYSVVVGPSLNTDTNGSTNTFNLTSGTVTLGSDATFARYLTLGNSNSATTRTSTAVVSVSGGTLTVSSAAGGLRFGNPNTTTGTSTGTFNLDGGTVQLAKVLAATQAGGTFNSTFNFNGGTLKVLTGSTGATTFMTGLGAANVKSGGAIIDTNSVATTIGQALMHDSGLGGTADGGLTKIGSGTLTLTGANTFTGNTAVSVGTLATGSSGGTFGAGNVTVANLAGLTAGNATSFADSATLTFLSSSTAASINLDFSGADTLTGIFDSGSIVHSFIGAGTYTASDLNTWFGGSVFTGTGSLTVSAIPEPATYAALAGLGILGLATCCRRRA